MGIATLASRVCFVLIGAALRGGILLMLAAAVVRFWPRASAAQRHVVWAVACCSLLLLPVFAWIVPVWRVSVPVSVLPATITPVIDRGDGTDQPAVSMAVIVADHTASHRLDTPVGRPLSEPVWLMVLLGLWGSGTLVILTVLVDNQRRARRLVSDARPLTDVWMLAVLARARSTVGVTHRVSVKLHASTVPIVWGVFRPAVVLPASARTWDEDRLYNILLHELAHIKRYDCLTQTLAFLACAVYWCNPLVWLAVRRLQTEQEQACDDVVLTTRS
jgi:bla regulator protein blaR1